MKENLGQKKCRLSKKRIYVRTTKNESDIQEWNIVKDLKISLYTKLFSSCPTSGSTMWGLCLKVVPTLSVHMKPKRDIKIPAEVSLRLKHMRISWQQTVRAFKLLEVTARGEINIQQSQDNICLLYVS